MIIGRRTNVRFDDYADRFNHSHSDKCDLSRDLLTMVKGEISD